jgi:hypothetical protein
MGSGGVCGVALDNGYGTTAGTESFSGNRRVDGDTGFTGACHLSNYSKTTARDSTYLASIGSIVLVVFIRLRMTRIARLRRALPTRLTSYRLVVMVLRRSGTPSGHTRASWPH